MSTQRRSSSFVLASLFILASAASVSAPAQQPASTEALSRYDSAFFARSQPASAYDMILLLPGFRLQEGNTELRGYSGAAGNVLIDGRRPASKEDSLEELLQRIPARVVDHVELIRNSSVGHDMQGHALLANIVRRRGSRHSGRLEGQYSQFRHGHDAPRLAGELELRSGEQTLDLQAAAYRKIDDEHGFGSRNRYAPDGSPRRLTDYQQFEGADYRELAGLYALPLGGGSFRAGGLFKDSRKFADIEHDIFFPAEALILGTERKHTRATEGELRWDRALATDSRLELLAIRRDTRVRATDTSRAAAGSELNHEASDAVETILRAAFRHKGARLSFEIGAEGANNTLDSHLALTEDGVEVALPAAEVRIEERRAELFATGTWQLVSAVTAEAGLRFETSRLTQSGDQALVRSLSYLKPRGRLTYAPSPQDQLRLLIERDVGQLDFADFASGASLTSGTITAGNRDLQPDSLWRAELAWEHRVGAGSLVLTGRQEWVRDVVDRVAVVSPEGVFNSVGNIGNGRRSELQLDANLPLDGAGLPGVTVKGSGLFRHSRVTDPQTGVKRRISEDAPIEATVSITHVLPARRLRWRVNYVFETLETEFRIAEIQRDRLANRVHAFVEYKPDAHWTLRLFGKNLTDSSTVRSRQIHGGLRGGSPPDYFDERILRSGRYFGINVQRTFGGSASAPSGTQP